MKKQNGWFYYVLIFLVGMAAGSMALARSADTLSASASHPAEILR